MSLTTPITRQSWSHWRRQNGSIFVLTAMSLTAIIGLSLMVLNLGSLRQNNVLAEDVADSLATYILHAQLVSYFDKNQNYRPTPARIKDNLRQIYGNKADDITVYYSFLQSNPPDLGINFTPVGSNPGYMDFNAVAVEVEMKNKVVGTLFQNVVPPSRGRALVGVINQLKHIHRCGCMAKNGGCGCVLKMFLFFGPCLIDGCTWCVIWEALKNVGRMLWDIIRDPFRATQIMWEYLGEALNMIYSLSQTGKEEFYQCVFSYPLETSVNYWDFNKGQMTKVR